jgi:hypothetical protein
MTMSFDQYCKENACTILTDDQTDSVCHAIQSRGFASADRIAYSDDGRYATLVVEGGNLEYYAGLEYCEESLDLKTRTFTAWRFEITETDRENGEQTIRVFDAACAAVAGEEVIF